MTAVNFENFAANQARGYASTVTRLARGFSESSRIRKTIKSKVEPKGKGKWIIRVTAGDGLPRDSSETPDVRAREYGSGIWARRGPKGKILIKPSANPKDGKKKKYLAFSWELANPNLPRLSDDRVLLRSVEHPGIDADNDGQGYIGPAIRETNKFIRKKFATDGVKAIKLDIRSSFKGAKRA